MNQYKEDMINVQETDGFLQAQKLREEALKLKSEGMAVTLIDKVIYGIPEVAELRFKRDVADTMYEVSKESINTLKLKIRILDNQISREWQASRTSISSSEEQE